MIQSGVLPLDHHLGGVQPGRLLLLTGGAGAGKTTACLEFLHAALRIGEAGVLLTLDRADDIVTHACAIGMQLEDPVRAHRLLIARLHSPLSGAMETADTARVLDELRLMMDQVHPARVAIDPLTPFLSDRFAGSSTLTAVLELLGSAGCTTILTYHGDVTHSYDARLAPVIQHAASIVHVTREDDGVHRMRAVQTRWRAVPPQDVRFRCVAGVGLVIDEPPQVEVVVKPKRTRARKTTT
jgi:KaiC/GvpD/RAD55 family RecA-like ATPase